MAMQDRLPVLAKAHPRCVVLGAGRSGRAAARLLRSIDASVALVDSGEVTDAPDSCDVFANAGNIPGGNFDLCVTSPSIPLGHAFLAECARRSIPVIAEMELGYAFWRGRILAVTGSKGKSSIVKLCADTISAAGTKAIPCGNYGTPLCDVVLDSPDAKWAVAETSSFQLEHVTAFRPDAAIILNIQADHLDRHGTMAEYARMKMRIFERQGAGCVAFVPEDMDSFGNPLPVNVPLLAFGSGEGADWRWSPGRISGEIGGRTHYIDTSGSWFDNGVLGPGAAAAAGAMAFAGLRDEDIAHGMLSFEPLPHRMQRVAEKGGVVFIDDSKATSLTATSAALSMAPGRVRLIAGGRLKETDVDFLKPFLSKRTRKVYLIGECEDRLLASWRDAAPCVICHTIDAAVRTAAAEAEAGDCVMLSPGCASFDQFKGYGQRGDVFAGLVKSIADNQTDDLEET